MTPKMPRPAAPGRAHRPRDSKELGGAFALANRTANRKTAACRLRKRRSLSAVEAPSFTSAHVRSAAWITLTAIFYTGRTATR